MSYHFNGYLAFIYLANSVFFRLPRPDSNIIIANRPIVSALSTVSNVENVKVFAMPQPINEEVTNTTDQSKMTTNEMLFAKLNSVFDEQNEFEDRKLRKEFFKKFCNFEEIAAQREDYSILVFHKDNTFRLMCLWLTNRKWFDNVILLFIALNCITLAMERPNIPPWSAERKFLTTANYLFSLIFAIEMLMKVVANGMFYGKEAYFTSGESVIAQCPLHQHSFIIHGWFFLQVGILWMAHL